MNIYKWAAATLVSAAFTACKMPVVVQKMPSRAVPATYAGSADTMREGRVNWQLYFTDRYLQALIDTALKNNQELNITLREIEMARNEVRARKGEYLPSVGIRGVAGVDKAARYTSRGASEANIEIAPGRETPEPLPDYQLAAYATWEVDIWHKLRNAKKAAVSRYLASTEGKNFVVTNLVAEVANAYYELLALDNQLDIVKQNIVIQSNALEIVKYQKEAARVTELAVRKFEAEVFKTRCLQFDIQQNIVITENRINFLLGRFPQTIERNDGAFSNLVPPPVSAGIPALLLANRPDIKKAELELTASNLDVQVAKARFYPSLGISAAVGYQAFNPSFFLKTPESILYSMIGELVAPVVNRNAIKAAYYTSGAK
ncbi:MAG: TolC family protein, partial [Taibaiella sp.]|nr:TolC family protein [Taibaiella sp.]